MMKKSSPEGWKDLEDLMIDKGISYYAVSREITNQNEADWSSEFFDKEMNDVRNNYWQWYTGKIQ